MIPKIGEKQKRGWFPTLVVIISIRLVINANISFRGASKALEIIFSQFEVLKHVRIPSYKSISRWLIRVGLYKLNLPKEQADDWACIIDNSIKVGTQKCLVILGARLSQLKLKALTFADVEVLHIAIHEDSDQRFICQALEKAQSKVGKFLMVCADDGPDLRGGISLFCEKYATKRVYDAIHKIGTFLKGILENDSAWQAVTQAAAEAKKKMQQTSAAHLMPPNQRSKCRFLNVDILVNWIVDAMSILTGPENPDKELLKKYCGWLLDYPELIERLKQMDLISKVVRQHMRDYGLSSETGRHIERLLDDAMKSASFNEHACQYAGMIIDFYNEHSKIVPANEVWIGSTEIIESLFGKFKGLEGEQHKSGFTPLVLAMAALTGKSEPSIVSEALLKIKTKDVEAWTKAEIGKTCLSKRRLALGSWRKKKRNKKKGTEKTSEEDGREQAGIFIQNAAGY